MTSETNQRSFYNVAHRAIMFVCLTALLLSPGRALAEVATNSLTVTATNAPVTSATEQTNQGWSFSISVYGYLVPESQSYAQPTFTADHDWLHLEARYNYENLETGSAWIGYNLGGGDKLSWTLTPMLGGVFGDTTGIAPGYSGSLSWWKLELYSEGEYVFDTGNSSNDFFYNWSELSISPFDWLRVGMVTQRTKVYQTDRDIQRGFLVGFSYKQASFTTYVFNPDESKPTVVLAAALQF
jgi:hypothetical protein